MLAIATKRSVFWNYNTDFKQCFQVLEVEIIKLVQCTLVNKEAYDILAVDAFALPPVAFVIIGCEIIKLFELVLRQIKRGLENRSFFFGHSSFLFSEISS
jgi:hypothetical protein